MINKTVNNFFEKLKALGYNESVDFGQASYAIEIGSILKSEREFGCCDRDRFIIKIEESLNYEQARDTFLHEILHAMFDVVGISCCDPDNTPILLSEEKIVEAVTKGLKLVAYLNPGLFEILLSRKVEEDEE